MKVVAILEDDVEVGGGFNQALNAIVQMHSICEGIFEYEVLVKNDAAAAQLRSLGVTAQPIAITVLDKVFRLACEFFWIRRFLRRTKLVSPLERNLTRRGCDLVYFVRQSAFAGMLQRVNFATTLFDLCHRDAPEFPEVREFGEFALRENLFRTHFAGAVFVLTDSTVLAEAAVRRYGLDANRLLVMPFSPAAFLGARSANKGSVLQKYGLSEGYVFYPAQFWAHKNHVRILEALVHLGRRGQHPTVVFCGGDKGNLSHVRSFADRNGLSEQVRFLGFVPADDIRDLYDAAATVVMPTYFGPTNLPPLEAWMMGKPLIYSIHCAEQVGDAALCVDPDDAEELARAIELAADRTTATDLVKRGTQRLQQVARHRSQAEAELLRRLRQFEARRRCWP